MNSSKKSSGNFIKNKISLSLQSNRLNQVGDIFCYVLKIWLFLLFASLFLCFLLEFTLVLYDFNVFDKFFSEFLDVSFHEALILLPEGFLLNQVNRTQLQTETVELVEIIKELSTV